MIPAVTPMAICRLFCSVRFSLLGLPMCTPHFPLSFNIHLNQAADSLDVTAQKNFAGGDMGGWRKGIPIRAKAKAKATMITTSIKTARSAMPKAPSQPV